MSLLTRSTVASMDANQFHQVEAGLLAGEDLDLVAPCYIKSSDGLVYMSNGTAANEAAEVVGFTARAVKSGQPVTLFGIGTRFKYSDSLLTPGDVCYLGATAGRLDTAPTTGDAFGYAMALTASDIVIIRTLPVLTSATVGAGTIGTTELAALGVTQAKLANGAASEGVNGGKVEFNAALDTMSAVPVLHRITIAGGANANIDVVNDLKLRVLDFWVRLDGAGTAGCLVTLKNNTDAISDAIDCSAKGDKDIARAGELDNDHVDIAISGPIRVTIASTGGDFPAGEAYVLAVPVA